MKVILKENLDNLGHIGDIVKVAPGYARNYLLPKGLALEATTKNAKALDHAKKHLEYKKNKVLEQARQFAAKIEGIALTLSHQLEKRESSSAPSPTWNLLKTSRPKGWKSTARKLFLPSRSSRWEISLPSSRFIPR